MWHIAIIFIQWSVIALCCWHLVLISRRLLEIIEILKDCRILLRLIFVGKDHKNLTGFIHKN